MFFNLTLFFKLKAINNFKYCFLALFFFLSGKPTQANNYYVSSSDGNDSYSSAQAQNPTTPWRSLTKANSFFSSLLPGDNLFFKRGDTFYGTLIASISGNATNKITIGAYGTGARPIFSGFTSAQNWTNNGNGIWQCTIPTASSTLNLVTINNQPYEMGRYPNSNAADGGYLNYESVNGTSFTDNQLTASPNWTGADVVMRKTRWILDICKITNHTGNSISYTNFNNANSYPGLANFGYFFQNDPRTLDKFGEWYFNNQTKVFQMFFGGLNPTTYGVNTSTFDNIVNLAANKYITVDNISIEGGNGNGFYTKDGNSVTIQNCEVKNAGNNGIYVWNVPNIVIENCQVKNVLSNGIQITNSFAIPSSVRNNQVSKCGNFAGMGKSGDKTSTGIYLVGNNFLVEYNTIDSTGYNALDFQGNNIMIKNNFINNFCSVKDDGGGIYTYGGDGSTVYSNRTIKENIVINAIGANYGTDYPSEPGHASGIYLDGVSTNVDLTDNSVAYCAQSGFFCNNITNVNFLRNTSFDAKDALKLSRFYGGPLLRNNTFYENILFPLSNKQTDLVYWNSELYLPTVTDIQTDMRAIGKFDNNYYRNSVDIPFDYYYHTGQGGSFVDPPPLDLTQWKSFMNSDLLSKEITKIPEYKINSVISSNSVQNGNFDAGIGNVGFFSSNTNVTSSWDNTGKISGGSLKVASNPSITGYNLIYAPLGSVTAGKSYILKVTTLGSSVNGYFKAALRQTNSPYATFTTNQNRYFGTSAQTHEFLITPSISENNASYIFEMQQSSGTVYFDNIEFYEVNATPISVGSQVRFEYNGTINSNTISLGANYIGVDNTKYSGNVTLAPFTSRIFILDTTSIIIPANNSFIANASASPINCFGGTTTTNVTASGGTAPYTGTGSFIVSAGKGSYKLTSNSAISSNTIYNYWSIGAISAAKFYVLRFSTLGSAASVNVKASLRQTSSPYATLSPSQSRTFGTSRVDHEFIFSNPTSDANASFLIEVAENSGTTYIDNIAVFESTSSGTLIGSNLYPAGDFENGISSMYSWSANSNHIVEWDMNSKINATNYFTVTDAIGAKRTAGIIIIQPTAPLLAASTAPNITVTGGTTTVTVSATGGTAPYTGIGNFTVIAGAYSYTVTDAKGCSSTTSITVIQTANQPGTFTLSGTAPPINCFGGTTTATVTASGGTAPYTGTGSFVVSAGKGSYKLTSNSAVSSNAIYNYWSIGAISAAKFYVLRFSTLGSAASVNVKASIRQTSSPYANLSPSQSRTFGTSRVDHEFIFSNPTTDANASFLIEVAENSGITYIDNIAFFESSSDGILLGSNLYPAGDFENGVSSMYSWSANNNHIVEWDINSKINGTKYYTVTDASGIVRTTGISINQPATPLLAASTAPNIIVNGGTTTVTVSATGGTAPYSGTGNFSVIAGSYSYIVTDAKGCSSTTFITVTQPANQPGSLTLSGTAPPINCFGGTTTVNVTASGGIAPYTGTGSFVVSAGKGSYKLTSNSAVNSNAIYNYWSIGAISAAKFYVLRFSTLGSAASVNVKASLRQTLSPYATLSPSQSRTFGTSRVDHEFIFSNPTTDANASFLIEIAENSGITYIDNIAFFESSADGILLGSNLYPTGDFENGVSSMYSWSANNNHIVEWDINSKINGTKYYTVTDASGIVRTTGIIINQPTSPLSANASAPNITTTGGTTTVAVSATGGTAPYTGTGNFIVPAGSYSYTVTDAKGCISTVTFTTVQASARVANSTIATSSTVNNSISLTTLNSFQISCFPNPSSTDFNLIVKGGTEENIYITVFGYDGRVLFKTVGGSNRKFSFGRNLLPGIYSVVVRQGLNLESIKLIKVNF